MKLTAAIAGMVMFAGVAPAYYHYVHYNSRSGPWIPVYEKFDLNALPNRTVNFFVSEQTNLQLHPSDTFTGLVSQIRAAAKVWNDVETSDLRVAFGGLAVPGNNQGAPSIELVFEEVPPGVVAVGGPTIRADFNGAFIPILKSVIMIGPDLRQRPTYGESFSGTLVHEFGHALGLQHSLTSSAMSTGITRATSKARPLQADDIAGISLLYPRNFGLQAGSISGRVTAGGQGVALASVVALPLSGPAVSALTNPDGTYRIEGLAPRQYLIYAHPLPPAVRGETVPANIVFPVDIDRRPLAPGPVFETLFYPSTKEPLQALPVQVTAGQGRDGVDLSVNPRGSLALHSVETYAFPANSAVKPPYIGAASLRPFLVAGGAGLVLNGAPTPGMSVRVIGGPPLNVRPYPSAPNAYVQIDVDSRALPQESGPRHLLFSLNNDIYVLPSAFYQQDRLPPLITSVAADAGSRTVTLLGSNFGPDTRVLFDGSPGVVQSIDEGAGRIIVSPPPATPGHRATIAALNSDGQSSLFLQGDAPPFFVYEGSDTPAALSVSPAALPAGSEAMITIDGLNTTFISGLTVIGLGSSDIVVKRVWVTGPTRLVANVAISGSAAQGSSNVTVVSGLHTVVQPLAFQVLPPNPRTITLSANVLNAATGQPALYVGAPAVAVVLNAPAPVNTLPLQLTINDRPVAISTATSNQITFQIPAGLLPGPAVLRLDSGSDRGLPIVISIEAAPPQIVQVFAALTQLVNNERPARPGELITLNVTGLADAGLGIAAGRVTVNVGGSDVPALQVFAQAGFHQVFFTLPANVAAGNVPVTVSIDGRASAAVILPVR